jgi:hypothetical protein
LIGEIALGAGCAIAEHQAAQPLSKDQLAHSSFRIEHKITLPINNQEKLLAALPPDVRRPSSLAVNNSHIIVATPPFAAA